MSALIEDEDSESEESVVCLRIQSHFNVAIACMKKAWENMVKLCLLTGSYSFTVSEKERARGVKRDRTGEAKDVDDDDDPNHLERARARGVKRDRTGEAKDVVDKDDDDPNHLTHFYDVPNHLERERERERERGVKRDRTGEAKDVVDDDDDPNHLTHFYDVELMPNLKEYFPDEYGPFEKEQLKFEVRVIDQNSLSQFIQLALDIDPQSSNFQLSKSREEGVKDILFSVVFHANKIGMTKGHMREFYQAVIPGRDWDYID
jgi:hypothetical protein